jgi:SpoVK/Ycf46/Vps4 family AAA+-type ATPase
MPDVLRALTYKDPDAQRRFAALVGIDQVKDQLLAALRIAVNPQSLREWARTNEAEAALGVLLERPQFFLLAGDVGTGKTELAETIGDALARAEACDVTMFTVSLSARGTGFVGEMTQRIVSAFDYVRVWGEKRKDVRGSRRSAGLLFIDEGDAIAQSRETDQMHHEDRAGVNALIRGIDDLTRARVPVGMLMATNRLSAIDPAIRRRAANVFQFTRPNDEQRQAVFERFLAKRSSTQMRDLVKATGPLNGRAYGYTYSDLVQRLLPAAVLKAYTTKSKLSDAVVLSVVQDVAPTPPFGAETG